jgi:hypothetical protein
MTETPLSEQDMLDLEALGETAEPTQRTILAIWKELLSNVEASGQEKVTPGLAVRIVRTWTFLTFQDTPTYHTLYHTHLKRLRGFLHEALEEHPNATQFVGDEDYENNRQIYIDLLARWNFELDEMESRWDASSPTAGILLAVIADLRVFIMSAEGLAGHLDTINFQLTEDEFRAALAELSEDKSDE